MYEVRKDLPFYVPLKVFRWFWFFYLDPKEHSMAPIGKIILLLILIISQWILPAFHLFKIVIVYKDIGYSEDIAILIGSFGFCLVCYKTMYNHQQFNNVFRNLSNSTRFGKPTTFDAETKNCNLVSIIFLIYTSAGVILYGLLSIYETRHSACVRYQAETSMDLFCTAVYPIWLPFKMNKTLVFFAQVSIAVVIYTPSGQICSIVYGEVSLIVSHIHFFYCQLRNAFHESDIQKRSRMLGYCAEYHSHIINLAWEVDELQRSITGHLALVWAVSMGCISNQLLSMYKPVGAVLYLLGYLMSLSCFIIAGQTLQTESEAVADKLYSMPWYLGTIKEQKIVMFIIMRAQIPLTLSAKPFGKYEYALLVTIVKTAYSYVTLLQGTA